MKVAVVGGGPSGLTLADILGREAPGGFEVTYSSAARRIDSSARAGT